jgi:hypothetical protein
LWKSLTLRIDGKNGKEVWKKGGSKMKEWKKGVKKGRCKRNDFLLGNKISFSRKSQLVMGYSKIYVWFISAIKENI